jgi:lycopene cyclase domain-containing protein
MAFFSGCCVCFGLHVGSTEGRYGEEEVKEYTILAVASALFVVWLDHKLKTNVLRRRIFWVFLAVMYFFKTIVNGYLTWRPIVIYGEPFYFGIRLGTIPIEDYVYGFSLVTLSIVLWEYLMNRSQRQFR